LVDLCDNWVADFLEVLEVLFKFVLLSLVVGGNPVLGFLECVSDGFLVILVEFIGKLLFILDLVAHLVNIVIELMFGINLFFDDLVRLGELLGLFNHALDLLLGETALIVSDSDGLSFTGTLLVGANSQDAVFIDLEGDLNLGSATRSWGDSVKVELTEVVVVLDKGTLTFEDGNGDSSLLVLVSSESLGLLGGNDGTTFDNLRHNTTNGLNSEGKGSDINEEDILSLIVSLASENTSLDGSTISDSLIGVNTTVGFFSIEEVLHELLNLGDTGGTTDKYDFINLSLLETRVVKDLLDGLEGLLEKITAEFFESSTGDSLLEIDSINESFNVKFDLND